MAAGNRKVLLIFIDGLGVGSADPEVNPLRAIPDLWPAEASNPCLGDLIWTPLDACLGVEGLPQSATGQTALLTGLNAPKIIGRHVQGFPSKGLINLIGSNSIFVQLKKKSFNATFANAYRHPEDIRPGSRLSVTSHAFKASGKPFRSLEQMQEGQALYHDFTNQELITRGYQVPAFTPGEAGKILHDIALGYDFTLYEHFMTDVVAHRGSSDDIAKQIDRLSEFIRSVLVQVNKDKMTVLITSDHGNIEDSTTRTHTRNSVPLLWTKNEAISRASAPADICGITPLIVLLLEQSKAK